MANERWSSEREAELKRLWEEGRDYAEIARMLTPPVTMNVLVGKLNRLGLKRANQPRAGVKPAKTISLGGNYKYSKGGITRA